MTTTIYNFIQQLMEMVKAGFKNIKTLDYPNMRHEILHELDYKKVYVDMKNFFDE